MNRIHEIEDTNAKLNADKIEYHQTIENENKELRTRLDQITVALKSQLDESMTNLESKIDNNYDANVWIMSF
jgi:F0F1-type ATP synthase membrane subunit b/b'